MKINYFKVIGMIGMLAEELSRIAEDGKITIKEALDLIEKICDQLGLDFDQAGIKLEAPEEPEELKETGN